jgi:hypothetical protein
MRNPKGHRVFARFARLSTGALAPTSFPYVDLVVTENQAFDSAGKSTSRSARMA